MFVQKVNTGTVDYYPEYAGNREREPGDQFFLRLRPLTKADKDAYQRHLAMYMSDSKRKRFGKVESGMRSNSLEIQRKIFIERVDSIHNFGFEFPGEEGARPPKSNEELYDLGDSELIEEICTALNDSAVLEEGKKKQ